MSSLKFYNTDTSEWEVIQTDAIGGVIPNNQTWTAIQGQTTFTIANGQIADPKLIQVFVNHLIRTDFTMTNNTTFQFLTNLNSGDQVYAEWFEVSVPVTTGHHSTHEINGQDEIDITKLVNYTEDVATPISNLQTSATSLQTTITNHTSDKTNPHAVTATQVGSYTKAEADGKYINGTGQSLSVIQASFAVYTGGTANVLRLTVTFPKAYSSAPAVMPANIVQTISFCDTMAYPLISSVTTTSFNVELNLTNSANDFGVGVLKMNFLVFGK